MEETAPGSLRRRLPRVGTCLSTDVSRYLFNVIRLREDDARAFKGAPSLLFLRKATFPDGLPPSCPSISPLHPALLFLLLLLLLPPPSPPPPAPPSPSLGPVTSGPTFFRLRDSTAAAQRGRRRLVASSQTQIKRAIDVGKSPGNLPACLIPRITQLRFVRRVVTIEKRVPCERLE